MRLLFLLACLATSACREATALDDEIDAGRLDAPNPDARVRAPDARPGQGVDAAPSGVSAIGRPDRVDVVCWNVRQYPATPSTPAALAQMILDLQVDVVALFEIDDDAAFQQLVDLLPGWGGYLGEGDGYIKGALVWRESEVSVTGLQNLFPSDYDFPREPIAATVTKGSDSMTLITVHLKAGRYAEDAQRRENSNGKLVDWLATRGNPKALVCGDFNEDLDNGYAPDVYAAWLAQPETYNILTASLDHGGAETYLPGNSVMFDQMIATSALSAELTGEAAFIPPLDRQVSSYLTNISDHLPVAVRIDLH